MRESMSGRRIRTHKRSVFWSLLLVLAGAVLVPGASYIFAAVAPTAQAQWKDAHNPRSDYWRDVRHSVEGTTNVRAPGANVLIQNGGQNWRQLRNGVVASITPWFMAVMLVMIGLFHLLVGPGRLKEARSGRTIQRWTLYERTLHWYTAILFILMAISGLSLLFGRAVLIPLFGHAGFGAYAWIMKYVHNFLGPPFTAGVLLIIISWIRWNVPKAEDARWLAAFFKKDVQVPAGRMNGGEKIWFWFIAIFGLAVCITGLIMDFPNFQQTRGTMQVANLIHSSVAVLWISIFFGHAYIATLGTEGALEGMTRGDVSVEWARQHHALWYKEVVKQQDAAPEQGGRHGVPGPEGV